MTPDEMLAKTGYPCGGTPSFGFAATFLIDPRVMRKDEVYTGGGSETTLGPGLAPGTPAGQRGQSCQDQEIRRRLERSGQKRYVERVRAAIIAKEGI